MDGKDISGEKLRCYGIYSIGRGRIHEITIRRPKLLFWEPGHSFHRIFDGVCTHLAPVPGFIYDQNRDIIGYCELLWEPDNKKKPCAF